MGKVPALKHGDTVITEVAAICTYLADEFPQAKLNVPVGTPRRGVYLKWLFFGPGCIEPAVIDRACPRKEEARRAMLGYGDFDTTMNVVAEAVEKGPWLMGEQFTAADVVIGSQHPLGHDVQDDPGAAGVRRLCGADRRAPGRAARRGEGQGVRRSNGGVRRGTRPSSSPGRVRPGISLVTDRRSGRFARPCSNKRGPCTDRIRRSQRRAPEQRGSQA